MNVDKIMDEHQRNVDAIFERHQQSTNEIWDRYQKKTDQLWVDHQKKTYAIYRRIALALLGVGLLMFIAPIVIAGIWAAFR